MQVTFSLALLVQTYREKNRKKGGGGKNLEKKKALQEDRFFCRHLRQLSGQVVKITGLLH